MKPFIFCYTVIRKFFDDEMPVYAASAAFWILISSVPFFMALLTLLQFVPGVDKESFQALLIQATPNMPQFADLIYSLTDNLFISAPSAVLSFSVILTLWSASTGVYGIEKGLRKLYGTKKQAGYPIRRLSAMAFTFLFIVILLLTLLLLVLGSTLEGLVSRYLPLLSSLISLLLSFRTLLFAGLLFLFFLFLYHMIPGRGRLVHRQSPGALFSAVGWLLFSYLFSIYFTYFRNISYMYGSLGALVLLMFWLYAIICIIFLGAELNLLLAIFSRITLPSDGEPSSSP